MEESVILDKMRHAFDRASIPLHQALEPDLRFEDIDGLDSVAVVRLIMALEMSFGLEIATRDVGKLVTVGDFVAYVQR